MFHKITIRTVRDGWPMDFELKPGEKPGPAIAWLEEHGYEPAAVGHTPALASEPIDGSATGQFAAEEMTATVDDGKVYWKVKGGQYQKYGVIVWPEVLEAAGFDPDEMNPLKPVDLVGWTAICSMKENGQPKKVIRLVAP